MTRPPAMLCVPVTYHRCRDGDTVEVSLQKSGHVWPIRLSDCSCEELSTTEGQEAKRMAEAIMAAAQDIYVEIPLDDIGVNILQSLTSFDRLVGKVWVQEECTLGDVLVEAGMGRRPIGPPSHRH